MKSFKEKVRATILKEYAFIENIDYVNKYIGDSKSVKEQAETIAYQINNAPDSLKKNFSNDTSDFKTTSYLLEILMYAIAKGGEYILPSTEKKINVNPDNIGKGIMLYMFPNYDYNKFAKFISGGDFKITGAELEYLDAEVPEMMQKVQDVLINIKKVVDKYLANEYFLRDNKSFVNFLQTALRYPLRDARKYLKKFGNVSIDEPVDDKRSKKDMLQGDGKSFDKDDDDVYSPEISDKLSIILKLNSDINNLLAPKKDLYEFFRLRIIGENGNEKVFGNTMSYGDIKKAYKLGNLETDLQKNISRKLLGLADRFLIKGYQISSKNKGTEYIQGRSDLLQQFKEEHPESFNDNGQLIPSPSLIDFLDANVKEDKLRPKTLFPRIRREIQDFFVDNKERLSKLNQIVSDAGLINPENNKPFSGMEYLNNLLKARTEKKQEKPSQINNIPKNPTVPVTEDKNIDKILIEDDENEKFSFNDILSIAKASVNYRNTQLQEARKKVRSIILKNSIKSI